MDNSKWVDNVKGFHISSSSTKYNLKVYYTLNVTYATSRGK